MNNSLLTKIVLIALMFVPVSEMQGGEGWFRKKKQKNEDFRTPEEKFVDDHFSTVNCTEWKPGSQFVFIGGDFTFLFRRADKNITDTSGERYLGKIFNFDGITEERGLDGTDRLSLIFDCEGEKFICETQKSHQEVSKSGYEPLLPNLVMLDEVERADRLLKGKRFYIMTPVWYDESGSRFKGRKLIPVTIEQVEAGDYLLPYKVTFRDDSTGRYSVRILMKSRASSGNTLTFDRVFGFEDPRLKYKEINDTHWGLITQGKVMNGMNKQACQLALGSPTETEQFPYYDGLREQWTYRDGSYLYFENGLLVRYRY